jgi:hypothetical protein
MSLVPIIFYTLRDDEISPAEGLHAREKMAVPGRETVALAVRLNHKEVIAIETHICFVLMSRIFWVFWSRGFEKASLPFLSLPFLCFPLLPGPPRMRSPGSRNGIEYGYDRNSCMTVSRWESNLPEISSKQFLVLLRPKVIDETAKKKTYRSSGRALHSS